MSVPPHAELVLLPDLDSPQYWRRGEGEVRSRVVDGWRIGGACVYSKWFESDLWVARAEDPEGQLAPAQFFALCAGAGGQGAGAVLTGRLLAFVSSSDSPLRHACTAESLLSACHAHAQTLVPSELSAFAVMTCVRAIGRQVELAHAGDTRAYRVSRGTEWTRLTTEQTVYRSYADTVSEQDRFPDPGGSLSAVTSAIGPSDGFRTETCRAELLPDDMLILCTSPVWRALDRMTIPPLPSDHQPRSIAAWLLHQTQVDKGAVVVATYAGD